MNYMKHLQRSPELQAHELLVNCLDAREWDQDKKRYCMLYCNVYEDFDEYIDAVEREYAKLKKAYLEGKPI